MLVNKSLVHKVGAPCMTLTDIYSDCDSLLLLSLVPRPHPLTRRNGLVNQVEFLGLALALATL